MLCNFLPGNLDQFWHLEGTILFVSFQVVMELERFQLEFAKDKKMSSGIHGHGYYDLRFAWGTHFVYYFVEIVEFAVEVVPGLSWPYFGLG